MHNMYSGKAKVFLEKNNVEEGSKIEVDRNGNIYKGIVMPRGEFCDPDTIVLKLESGYNVGLIAEGLKFIENARKKQGKSGKI